MLVQPDVVAAGEAVTVSYPPEGKRGILYFWLANEAEGWVPRWYVIAQGPPDTRQALPYSPGEGLIVTLQARAGGSDVVPTPDDAPPGTYRLMPSGIGPDGGDFVEVTITTDDTA